MPRPLILLTNDDGVDAPGLAALQRVAEDMGEVWVVAPAEEQSCVSHSITLSKEIAVEQLGPRRFAVHGKPADAVIVALGGLLPQRPALCLSGINRGYNLGTDVFYSGTVAGAREAALAGISGLAVSVEREKNGQKQPDSAINWDTAAGIAKKIAQALMSGSLPPGLWNLNVPNRQRVESVKIGWAGPRKYTDVLNRVGPGLFRISGKPSEGAGPETDIDITKRGYASLTPLSVDPTDRYGVEKSRGFND